MIATPGARHAGCRTGGHARDRTRGRDGGRGAGRAGRGRLRRAAGRRPAPRPGRRPVRERRRRGGAARAGDRRGRRAGRRRARLLQGRRPAARRAHRRRGRRRGGRDVRRIDRRLARRRTARRRARRVRRRQRRRAGRPDRRDGRRPLRVLRDAHALRPLPAAAPRDPAGARTPAVLPAARGDRAVRHRGRRRRAVRAAQHAVVPAELPDAVQLRRAPPAALVLLPARLAARRAGVDLRAVRAGGAAQQVRGRHRHLVDEGALAGIADPGHQRALQRHRAVAANA